MRTAMLKDSLSRGKNVIIDNLNTDTKHFDEICEIAQYTNRDVQVYEKSFFVELKIALARNANRDKPVPEDVIKRKWEEMGGVGHKHYKARSVTFTKRENLIDMQNTTLPKAIICDLDGTLAIINGRSPYDTAKSANDIPNKAVIETVKLFSNAGQKIIFCTGREEKFRDVSQLFIECHTGLSPEQYELLMRSDEDNRKDNKVKQEIYDQHIKPRYYVTFVLDDRNSVVNMWRENGLSCFQVNSGDF